MVKKCATNLSKSQEEEADEPISEVAVVVVVRTRWL
jgi:hypothetical protein